MNLSSSQKLILKFRVGGRRFENLIQFLINESEEFGR